MDQQAAKEYHAHLWTRINARPNIIDRLLWIPLMGGLAYFALNSLAALGFGAASGWAVCAILSRLDAAKRELYICEFYRHLHEHTDEAEAGKAAAEMQKVVEQQVKPWWMRIQ